MQRDLGLPELRRYNQRKAGDYEVDVGAQAFAW